MLVCWPYFSLAQALVPLFIEEDEGVLLAVWTATGAATAAVPKVGLAELRAYQFFALVLVNHLPQWCAVSARTTRNCRCDSMTFQQSNCLANVV